MFYSLDTCSTAYWSTLWLCGYISRCQTASRSGRKSTHSQGVLSSGSQITASPKLSFVPTTEIWYTRHAPSLPFHVQDTPLFGDGVTAETRRLASSPTLQTSSSGWWIHEIGSKSAFRTLQSCIRSSDTSRTDHYYHQLIDVA